jgi:hypothetical protein
MQIYMLINCFEVEKAQDIMKKGVYMHLSSVQIYQTNVERNLSQTSIISHSRVCDLLLLIQDMQEMVLFIQG